MRLSVFSTPPRRARPGLWRGVVASYLSYRALSQRFPRLERTHTHTRARIRAAVARARRRCRLLRQLLRSSSTRAHSHSLTSCPRRRRPKTRRRRPRRRERARLSPAADDGPDCGCAICCCSSPFADLVDGVRPGARWPAGPSAAAGAPSHSGTTTVKRARPGVLLRHPLDARARIW